MATHRFGYIIVIILQQLTITGMLWAVLRLREHVRRLSHVAEREIQIESLDLSLARLALAHRDSGERFSEPAVAEKPRAFTAAAG